MGGSNLTHAHSNFLNFHILFILYGSDNSSDSGLNLTLQSTLLLVIDDLVLGSTNTVLCLRESVISEHPPKESIRRSKTGCMAHDLGTQFLFLL